MILLNFNKLILKTLNLNGELFLFRWTAAAIVAASYISSRSSSRAAEGAANTQSEASDRAIDEQRRQFDVTNEQFRPYREAGTSALTQQEALTGTAGPKAQQAYFDNFIESPGQQFIRKRQQRALLQNAAAIGGIGGGNVRTDLQEQAAGFAQQDIGNQFNRLASISGTGQTATQNTAQFGANTTNNISNLLQQQGQARASGILGQAQARNQFYNTVGQTAASYGR